MGLTIDVGVESNDSGVIDKLLKVSDLAGVVWAACAKSLDLSLKVSNSLSSASDHSSFHFCEVSIHIASVISYEIGKSLEFSTLISGELVSVVRKLLDHFVSDGINTGDELILLVESLPDESLPLIVAG